MTLALALVDLAIALYLLGYAARRQRRNREGLVLVGVTLLGVAIWLGWLGLRAHTSPEPVRGPLPTGTAV